MTEVELMKQISERLTRILKYANTSQRELSEMTGISESTISRYTQARSMPSVKHLINIAYALECEIGELIDADVEIV